MNRKQSVRNENGHPTGYRPIASGVPQDSILDSLLFLLFIRDLPQVLRHSSCRIYADNTQTYHHFYANDIISAIARVQMDAQAVADWAHANGLGLNESKTKIMLMGSMRHIASIDISSLPQAVLNGNRIKYLDSVKSLGVTITPTLPWDLHVGNIQAKVYGSLKPLNFRH